MAVSVSFSKTHHGQQGKLYVSRTSRLCMNTHRERLFFLTLLSLLYPKTKAFFTMAMSVSYSPNTARSTLCVEDLPPLELDYTNQHGMWIL
jgi:hypothetical protein